MKCCLEVRARPEKTQRVADKHDKLVAGIGKLSPPWTWENGAPAVPGFGGGITAHANIGRQMGKGITGNVYYQFRRDFRGEACEDDLLELTFDSKKIDYGRVLNEVFPALVVAFDAYVGQVQPDELINRDLEVLQQIQFDSRKMIPRIYPSCYFDAELIKKALNVLPSQVVMKLQTYVEKVEAFHKGVLIVLSSQLKNIDEVDTLSKSIRQLLV